MPIVAEAPDYIRVFSDGSVKRFDHLTAPPSNVSINGFKSKDFTIDHSKPITARIYLPDTPKPDNCLPVLVYFHGGGFCVGSTTWLGYHHFLGGLSFESQSIVLSIDYRLAPENRLPAAYDDCYSSLEWLSHHAKFEPWLERADLSHVFLSGDSAGGNIVHQTTLRAVRSQVNLVLIKGLMPIHPYFGSQNRTNLEKSNLESFDVSMNDFFWNLSLPEGSNRDYFGCNFEKEVVTAEEWQQFPAVVIYVAGLDFLKERGVMYFEFLKRNGVKDVKLVEAEGETHVYHVYRPLSEAAKVLQKQMSEFINSI
ncbi:hypothetical protein LguiA_033039 [Lonicera macranthoides]